MAFVYSVRLCQGTQTTGAPSAIYTAPATGTVIVRDIRIAPSGGSPNQGDIFLNLTENIAQYIDNPAGQPYHEECRLVLLPGDVLEALAITQNMNYVICGYLLD